MEDFKLKVAPIRVHDGSWIAAASFIAPGVEIGPNAMVSAGSVVFKNVKPGTRVRGNPAGEETRNAEYETRSRTAE